MYKFVEKKDISFKYELAELEPEKISAFSHGRGC